MQQITVDLNFNADEDFEHQIIDQVAKQLKDEMRHSVKEEITTSVQDVIRSEVVEVVKQTLCEPIQLRTRWGEKDGKTTTLRDLIMVDVREALEEEVDGKGHNRKQSGYSSYDKDMKRLDWLIQTHVRDVLMKELKKELNDAIEKMRDGLKDNIHTILSDAMQEVLRLKNKTRR